MADSDLVIGVSGDTKQLEDQLKKLDGVAKKALVGMTAGVAAFSVAIGGAVTKTAQMGDRIDKLSQKIGVSREAFQKWDFIMSQNGASIESLQGAMRFLSKAVDEGSDAFKKLGISQSEIARMTPEQLFERVVTGLQNMEQGVQRNAIATKLFGRGYQELAPLLNQTADSTDALKTKFDELGMAMSDEAVDAAVNFSDALDQLKRSAESSLSVLFGPLMAQMARTMDELSQKIGANKAKVREWGSSLSSTMSTLGGLLSGIINMFNGLPDFVKGPAGVGIIGAILFGSKLGVIAATVIAVTNAVKELTPYMRGLMELGGGDPERTFGVFGSAYVMAKENLQKLKKLLSPESAEVKDTGESYAKGLEYIRQRGLEAMKKEEGEPPIKHGASPKGPGVIDAAFGAGGKADEAKKALREIQDQINALGWPTYAQELDKGLAEVAEKAKKAGLAVEPLQQQFQSAFEAKKAREAAEYVRSLDLEIAQMNGDIATTTQLQLDIKLDEMAQKFANLYNDTDKAREAMEKFGPDMREAFQAQSERGLLERQISSLNMFRESVPWVTETVKDLNQKLIDLQIVDLEKLFQNDEKALEKIRKLKEEAKNFDTFGGGLKMAFAEVGAKAGDAAQQAKDAFTSVFDTIKEAGGMMFDALFDGVEFRADKLLKNLGKMLFQQGFNQLIGKGFGLLGSLFHDGGIVGVSNAPQRMVDIPKFHAGLASDEFLAILQKGEAVLTEEQQAVAASKMQRGDVNIVVQNIDQVGVKTRQEKQIMPDGTVMLKNFILDTVNGTISGRGSTANAIGNTFGLQSQAWAR